MAFCSKASSEPYRSKPKARSPTKSLHGHRIRKAQTDRTACPNPLNCIFESYSSHARRDNRITTLLIHADDLPAMGLEEIGHKCADDSAPKMPRMEGFCNIRRREFNDSFLALAGVVPSIRTVWEIGHGMGLERSNIWVSRRQLRDLRLRVKKTKMPVAVTDAM